MLTSISPKLFQNLYCMEKSAKHAQNMTKPVFSYTGEEHSACGVGFIVSRKQEYSHEHLKQGLHALRCVEHRGACAADGLTGDGAGIMTDIPFDMLGYEKDTVAVAFLFLTRKRTRRLKAHNIFEQTFGSGVERS